MAIGDEKYVRLTTYTRAGEAKHTAVWIADLGDGTVGFTTSGSSWKVKRLRNDPRVELVPSDSKGRPRDGAASSTGTATVEQGAGFGRVRAVVKGKYGIQYTMIELVGRAARLIGKGSGTDTAVVVTLD